MSTSASGVSGSKNEMNVRNTDRHREYRIRHPVVVTMALAFSFGGFYALANPRVLELSSIGATLPGWLQIVWALVYTLGGMLTLVGVFTLDSRFEALGLCLSAGASLVWCVCVFHARGSSAGVLGASFFLGVAVGHWVRAYLITTGRREPWARRH